MKSNKYLWEDVCMPIYRQMYKEAEPKGNIDILIRDGKTAEDNWFLNFFLPHRRQKEIFDYWCKKKKVTAAEHKKVSSEIWLGCAPRGFKNATRN